MLPNRFFVFILVSFLLGCNQESSSNEYLFSLKNNEAMGINFSNDLAYTEDFNPYTYRNFYNGGGVALGDINNDGLTDIYFSGNIKDNKLYLNKGNWRFEDISASAGVECKEVWSSGVSFVDINGDGFQDLYVCKAGKPGGERRHNELFINNGDLTFSEKSEEYGLDITGLSIHSAFFDYDKDGDLDCYLLNNSIRAVGGFDLVENQRLFHDPEGNKLLRNDNGKFVDVTVSAGIYSSSIGYGLGITLSDFNGDNWPDVFISNDFFERDYLYINNQDGTFAESGAEQMSSMSMGSMGADAADVNGDLLPDLFVTEMLPEDHKRRKTKTQFESWNKYVESVNKGYHHQYSRNVLHINSPEIGFFETGRLAGVSASEWSWASLIQDFNNDGKRDLYISNGIYKDLLDKDYLNFYANDTRVKSMIDSNVNVIKKLVDNMPSQAVVNHMYFNMGEGLFDNVSEDWGLGQPTFSNGSAYGDLDNDGDLDLVLNNVNMPCFIYENKTDTSTQKSIQFDLKGYDKNTAAIGAKVLIDYNNEKSMSEIFTSRGFESTVSPVVHFGLGPVDVVDSVEVIWPDGKVSITSGLKTNKRYILDYKDAIDEEVPKYSPQHESVNSKITFEHKEIGINQFARERMLMQMTAHNGPALAIADVNSDGVEDVFVGGGKNQPSEFYLSNSSGEYTVRRFENERRSETVEAEFFDADNDGDLDLYVAHGGKIFSKFVPELNDVLYINNGDGKFTINSEAFVFPFPISTGDIDIGDLDNDGDKDIVVVEQMKTELYGAPGSIYILENNGNGTFEIFSPSTLQNIGMMTSVSLSDVNGNNNLEIVVAGEWMPITIIESGSLSLGGEFTKKSIPGTSGIYHDILLNDLDNDGDIDLVLANHGMNNFLSPKMKLYVGDLDNNGMKEQLYCELLDGHYYPIHDIDEMTSQMPSLKKRHTYYNDFASASIENLIEKDMLDEAISLEIDDVRSMILENTGSGFSKVILPIEFQYSSLHALKIIDKKEGKIILAGGNDYNVKPQFGRQDASLGWRANIASHNGEINFSNVYPLGIKGQIRDIDKFGDSFLFAINNDSIKSYNFIDE